MTDDLHGRSENLPPLIFPPPDGLDNITPTILHKKDVVAYFYYQSYEVRIMLGASESKCFIKLEWQQVNDIKDQDVEFYICHVHDYIVDIMSGV